MCAAFAFAVALALVYLSFEMTFVSRADRASPGDERSSVAFPMCNGNGRRFPIPRARRHQSSKTRTLTVPEELLDGESAFDVCQAPLPSSVFDALRSLRVFMPIVGSGFCAAHHWAGKDGRCGSFAPNESAARQCLNCQDAVFWSPDECWPFAADVLESVNWTAQVSFSWSADLPSPIQRLYWGGRPWPSHGPLLVSTQNGRGLAGVLDAQSERFAPACMYYRDVYVHGPTESFEFDETEARDVLFVLAQSFDNATYHILVDLMPRILPHMQALLSENVTMVFGESPGENAYFLAWMDFFFGGKQRFEYLSSWTAASQYRYGRRVHMPVNHAPGAPFLNVLELTWLRAIVLSKLAPPSPAAPFTVLALRRFGSRRDAEVIDGFCEVIAAVLPDNVRIRMFDDNDAALMGCLTCQLQMFAEADVVLGFEGAGMSNVLFLRPGSLAVVFAQFDDAKRDSFFLQLAMLSGARSVAPALSCKVSDVAAMISNFARDWSNKRKR
jgi:hypothetical protein